MKTTDVSRAALGRIPVYLRFLESLPQDTETVSATVIAKELGFGEVQVRKDLGAICGSGKPRIGYTVSDLKKCLGGLIDSRNGKAVIVGAGKLGRALLDYGGFSDYGLDILAAFDTEVPPNGESEKPILPLDGLADFCKKNNVSIGVIAVPGRGGAGGLQQALPKRNKSRYELRSMQTHGAGGRNRSIRKHGALARTPESTDKTVKPFRGIKS